MTQTAQDPPEGYDTAVVHLWILGEELTFPVRVPLGPRRPIDLLPAARELTHRATAAALAHARAQGREISCRPGCGACCRQLVALSVVEAQALAGAVADLPPDRQREVRGRFASALLRLEEAGLLDPRAPRGGRALVAASEGGRRAQVEEVSRRYFALGIPCPFLEGESCSVHPERPLVCREYHVTSPAERCADLYRSPLEKVEPPLHMGEALARAAHRAAGTGPRTLPLVLALEWLEAHGAALERTHDGLGLFMGLLDEVDRENRQPFGERG